VHVLSKAVDQLPRTPSLLPLLPYTQLINEVNELGYAGTGRKYGVSDNSIRKWIKYYEKKEI
jgi:hypothetical protein